MSKPYRHYKFEKSLRLNKFEINKTKKSHVHKSIMKRTISIVLIGLTILSCSDSKNESNSLNQIKKLEAEKDSLKAIIIQNKGIVKNQMIRSLTFQDGNAENAMNFYVELFDNSKIIDLTR